MEAPRTENDAFCVTDRLAARAILAGAGLQIRLGREFHAPPRQTDAFLGLFATVRKSLGEGIVEGGPREAHTCQIEFSAKEVHLVRKAADNAADWALSPALRRSAEQVLAGLDTTHPETIAPAEEPPTAAT